MKVLTDLADKHGITIHLNAKPFGTSFKIPKKKLIEFYKKHGFVQVPYGMESKKLSDSMVRKPLGE